MKRSQISDPSKIVFRILCRILTSEEAYYLIGDIKEIYDELREKRGVFAANLWLWWQILISLPRFLHHQTYWSIQMFRNYLMIGFRNLSKDKLNSFIKIGGLTIGLACVFLIILFIRYELSYDSFNQNEDRIYRVVIDSMHDDGPFSMAPTMLPLVPALRSDFPEVEYAARISNRTSILMSAGEYRHYESMHFADPEIFSIFNLPLKLGNPETALSQPFNIVLTEDTAQKYFGDSNPVGKILRVYNLYDFIVTGVLQEIPDTFHLRINMLASFDSLKDQEKDRWESWDTFSNDYTYILLRSGSDPREMEEKLPAFQQKYAGPDIAKEQKLHLQALKDIHFSQLNYDDAITYEKSYLYAFSAVALFILILACINFINLAVANSAGRAKEVGMRKVVGAGRTQLMMQFLTESFFLAFIASAGAVGLVYLVLPQFREFFNRQVKFDLLSDPGLAVLLIGLFFFTGLFAGIYPAFLLSAKTPVNALRKKYIQGGRRLSFRMFFVVVQFSVSILLIIATLVVYQQLGFMKSKDLGFFSEQLIVIPLQNSSLRGNPDPFKNAIKNDPAILGVTCASGTPGSGTSNARTYILETPEGDKEVYVQTIYTDFNFVDTVGLKILDGRNFSEEFSTDLMENFILNETAARRMGWDSPVGKQIDGGNGLKGQVIGVVEDFHYDSMRSLIKPIALNVRPSQFRYMSVRINPKEITHVLNLLENTWKSIVPQYPFEYFFMNEQFSRYYRFEKRIGELFFLFSLLAVLISCLGVFGLITYMAEQSTKEIGMRKVLGASTTGIVFLLSKRFIRWVVVANLIAWPLAWFAMHKWLEGFAYRVSINPIYFPVAGIITLAITLATLLRKSLKAAFTSPVESLRYE